MSFDSTKNTLEKLLEQVTRAASNYPNFSATMFGRKRR